MRVSEAASDVPMILRWAHFYADLGFSIIPTAPGKKQPGLVWEPFQERRATKAELTTWLTGLYSSSGIGLVTGEISGNIFVVDADATEGKNGTENLDDLLMMHDDFPITWSARSGGGGLHYFFRAPPGVIIKNSKSELAQFVDVRGHHGFLVLPPSPHPCGAIYKWIDGVDPATTQIADAPEWLLRLCREDAHSLRFDGPQSAATTPARTEQQSRGSPAPSPQQGDFNAFGRRIDGREEYMRDLIWARLIEARREAPTTPQQAELETILQECWEIFERKVKARSSSLAKDGRGIEEMRRKLRYSMKKWDTRIAEEARKPKLDFKDWGEFQREASPDPARFRFETVADLRKLPPAKYLIDGWVPAGATGILYGKWGAGKSFIGFDQSLHLAYGMEDWHGATLPEGGCDVLVLAREGHSGFVGRVDAFKAKHGILDDTERMVFMRASVSFMRDEDFSGLCEAIRKQERKFKFVLIDTVARVLPGADMNEGKIVTLFMERCALISEISGAATVGVHHQNKSGTMMGSIYFEANADFVFEVTRFGEEDGPLREGEIVCTKMKDGEDRWKRQVHFEQVAFGVAGSSLVVASVNDTKAKQGGWIPPRDTCERMLKAIGEAWDAGQPFNHKLQAKAGGKYAQRMLSQQFDLRADIVERLIISWLDNDVLTFEMNDKKTKRMGLRVIGDIR